MCKGQGIKGRGTKKKFDKKLSLNSEERFSGVTKGAFTFRRAAKEKTREGERQRSKEKENEKGNCQSNK